MQLIVWKYKRHVFKIICFVLSRILDSAQPLTLFPSEIECNVRNVWNFINILHFSLYHLLYVLTYKPSRL